MRVSLPVVSSDRSPTLLARLARVLELAERALVDRVGAAPDPELFARYSAFRWEVRQGHGRLVPIAEPDRFSLDDLVGVERPLARLVANTEQFLAGLPSNHVLLFGERGTGKSSAVKGLLTRYAPQGMRVGEEDQEGRIDLHGGRRGRAGGEIRR